MQIGTLICIQKFFEIMYNLELISNSPFLLSLMGGNASLVNFQHSWEYFLSSFSSKSYFFFMS